MYSHLTARTPTADVPLNWPSDDSDTELLISAAEQFLSTQTNDRLDEANCTTCGGQPGLAEAAFHEPFVTKSPEAESIVTEPALADTSELTEGSGSVPPVRLSFTDLLPQSFDGGTVYKVSPEFLDSLRDAPHLVALCQQSEPALSVVGSGESVRLAHQASAPAQLEEAAVDTNPHQEFSVLPASNTTSNKSPDPKQPDDVAANSSLSYESIVLGQQLAATYQGARPKFPPTIALGPSPIPLFVEQHNDECQSDSDSETSSTVRLGRPDPPVVIRNVSGLELESSLVTQFPGTVITEKSSVEHPSHIGMLPELDLRNVDEPVSTRNYTVCHKKTLQSLFHCNNSVSRKKRYQNVFRNIFYDKSCDSYEIWYTVS